jgi:hypothetical protein
LVNLWIEHMGRPPPKTASTSLLLRAVAYAVQEDQLGGLKRQDLRLLLKTADSAVGSSAKRRRNKRLTAHDGLSSDPDGHAGPVAGRTSPTAAGSLATDDNPAISRTSPIALRPGTRLVREWQGRSHVVDVRADGFQWNRTIYRSLTAVALAITGARWSGNRFFRLG